MNPSEIGKDYSRKDEIYGRKRIKLKMIHIAGIPELDGGGLAFSQPCS
jgi:hypothetical protein